MFARRLTAVGDDDFGRFLLAMLKGNDVNISHIAVLPETRSGMSVAISDDEGDYGAVIVSGANLHADQSQLTDAALWKDSRILVLQNEMPEAMNIAAARAARSVGAKVCLNAAPFRPLSAEFKALIDVLVVNAIEAEQLSGLSVSDLASARDAAELLAKQFETVVATVGGDGVVGVTEGAPAILIPALPVTLVSTHGAGDVFVGTLAYALAGDAAFCESLKIANRAAAAHVAAPKVA
ncbi:PfkB family carbohydrate kinase (plasmid) [Aminobacter sp. NyZ550]|uniref:PfkB family carbohydrate kinase n=1 Tax=unclassified Aminobacter TaxID=2644704 RepID=UPI0021D60907|nr:PfkB family carbohydrate kinase [Aminobacter sp. NyZ550]WAX98728.1 PfkB family carbohydrate kinase [Aminobacter sp. NyZ550]